MSDLEQVLATGDLSTPDGRPLRTVEDLQRYVQEVRACWTCPDCGQRGSDHCGFHTYPCCPGDCNVETRT